MSVARILLLILHKKQFRHFTLNRFKTSTPCCRCTFKKIANVEVKQVDLPTEMQRAMARQAEAERERRAKVILAQGEKQASTTLAEAAQVMEKNPISLQLRYLQTMIELSNEKTSTVMIPMPIDLMGAFNKFLNSDKG